jgi:vancomycin permeability regulator SanA
MFKLIRRFISLIFLAIIAIPGYFYAQVWWGAHYPVTRSSDYAVVMGAAQYDGRPSDALEARLEKAFQLYQNGLVKKIITVGAGAPGDRFTEASAGREWLITKGVPRKAAISIPIGRNTIDSTIGYVDYLKKLKVNEVIIVTDPYHCKRATYIATDKGVNATCAPVQRGPYSLQNSSLHYLWREGSALIAYRTLEKLGVHVSDHLESTGLSVVGLG